MYVCGECGQRYDAAGACANEGARVFETDDARLGTEVGRYRLARLLGEGGMGRVYLGVQPQIGSRVAIKLLSDECARDPGLLERFFAEARAVNMIRHENIVAVIDLAQLPGGQPYIVMEFVAGHTLAQLVRGAMAPLGGVVQVMREVLSALAAAHAIGIVHRDLKPDNVIVTVEGHAKVLDFGIAKLAPGMRGSDSPRTATGALLGTPAYMSPEQISGADSVDARTDVYAAGIVLFEAVTGRPPFAGATLYDLMRAHMDEPPPSPRALRPDLPDSIEQVILQALRKAPAERFADAGAMGEALHRAAAALPMEQWRALSSRADGMVLTPHAARPLAAPATVAYAPHGVPTISARQPSQQQQLPSPHPPPYASPPPAAAPAASGSRGLWITLAVVLGSGVIAAAIYATRATPRDEPAGGGRDDHHAGDVRRAAETTATGTTFRAPVIVTSGDPTAGMAAPVLDYVPSHFDPIAYLPSALAQAHKLLPDAELTEFEFYESVWSDGHVDLTLGDDSRGYYEFRSPSVSPAPPHHPQNMAPMRGCYVSVDITKLGAEARVRQDDACDHQIHATPKCSLADVWKLAIAEGEPHDDVVVTIAFLHDGTWFFDPDHAGRHPGQAHVRSFPDCK